MTAPDGSSKGYIESGITGSKTSFSLERKTRYLNIVCPSLGLEKDAWGTVWFKLLTDHGPEGKPLLPAPLTNGQWTEGPMKIQEATKWLRSLMRTAGVGAKDAHLLGTHSLKATCLSWCAKWGVERQTRALLGFHSKGKDGAELVYGRDNMSAPLRELNVVISAVASGSFDPDATRSGMFAEEDLRARFRR